MIFLPFPPLLLPFFRFIPLFLSSSPLPPIALGLGQSLGYAFVNYARPEDARKALGSMNGLRLQNKVLKVGGGRMIWIGLDLRSSLFRFFSSTLFQTFRSFFLRLRQNISIFGSDYYLLGFVDA